MPDLGPHAIFILAAYGVTFVAVAALAFVDRRGRPQAARASSPSSSAKGIRRRSARAQAGAEQAEVEAESRAMSKRDTGLT